MKALCCMLCCASLLLGGCEKSFRNMYDQPRYEPLEQSPLWPDGRASRPQVAGTIAATGGVQAGASSGHLGAIAPAADFFPVPLDAEGKPLGDTAPRALSPNPLPINAATLARGRERYQIFCEPCHSPVGDGDGLIARRGFPHPPSYHIERLRNAPDAHFYGVITHGYGLMYPYAERIDPPDRWAIVAYIRALQRSQHASLADVPQAQRAALEQQP